MRALRQFAIQEIARRKDEERARAKATREHATKIANSSSRVRKALWKTHQNRNKTK